MLKLRPVGVFFVVSTALVACTTSAPNLKISIKPHEEARSSPGARVDHYELGNYYHANGRLGLAMEAYAQALKINSGHIEARNALAKLYSQQGRLSEAEALLREVVKQGTSAAYLHNNLGYIYYLQGNHVAAIRELRNAVNLDPGHEWARNNLKLAEAALDRRMAANAQSAPQLTERAESTIKAFEVWGEAKRAEGKLEQDIDASRRTTIVESSKPARPEVTPNANADIVAQVLSEPAPRVLAAPILPKTQASNRITPIMAKPLPLQAAVQAARADARNGKYRLEVSNGNGVTGFARRVSQIFVSQGIPVHSLTNHLPFQQVTTEIQYRDGFEHEAEKIKDTLRGYAIVARSDAPRQWIDLRVVLGKDVTTRIAEIDIEKPARLANSTFGPERL